MSNPNINNQTEQQNQNQQLSQIASQNIILEPQFIEIPISKNNLNASRYSKDKINRQESQKINKQQIAQQFGVQQKEQTITQRNNITGLAINLDPNQFLQPTIHKIKTGLKIQKQRFISYNDISAIQSRDDLTTIKHKKVEIINNIQVVRRREAQKIDKQKQAKIGYYVWVNRDYLKQMKLNNEQVSTSNSNKAVSNTGTTKKQLVADNDNGKKKNNSDQKAIKQKLTSQLYISVSKSDKRQIILEQIINSSQLQSQLSVNLSFTARQVLQIRKIHSTSETSQSSSVQQSQNRSILQQQQQQEQYYSKFNGPIVEEQRGIRYRIQKLVNKIKLNVIVYQNQHERNWKDIQLPVGAYDLNTNSLLRIVEKVDGHIQIHFDEFMFSFYYKQPVNLKKYYVVKGSAQIYEMGLQQRQPNSQIINSGCESKCLIF